MVLQSVVCDASMLSSRNKVKKVTDAREGTDRGAHGYLNSINASSGVALACANMAAPVC